MCQASGFRRRHCFRNAPVDFSFGCDSRARDKGEEPEASKQTHKHKTPALGSKQMCDYLAECSRHIRQVTRGCAQWNEIQQLLYYPRARHPLLLAGFTKPVLWSCWHVWGAVVWLNECGRLRMNGCFGVSTTWSGRNWRGWWHRCGGWCFVPFCRQMVSLQGASLPHLSLPFLHCKTSLWVLCWCSSPFAQIWDHNVKKRRPICPSQPLARRAVSSPPSFSTLQVRTAEQLVSFSPADPQKYQLISLSQVPLHLYKTEGTSNLFPLSHRVHTSLNARLSLEYQRGIVS